jgi:Rrf2 family protein
LKLSTKGKYGLKAMFELAVRYGQKPVSLTIIAENQNISLNYLEQLISKLKKENLVKSYRGAHGGYTLAKPPEDISVSTILNCLEGGIVLSECLEGDGHVCENVNSCVTRPIWEKINESINEIIENMTLADMVNDHKKNKE